MLPGTAVSASILRQPSTLAPGQTSAYTTVFTLTLRKIEGLLWQEPSGGFSPDALGVQVTHGGVCFAEWPTGVTSPTPIRPDDMLKLADGTEYPIVDARARVGLYIRLLVELAV